MFLERRIAKDSWRLNLPAEQMTELGINKGDNLAIYTDKDNNRIILTPAENALDNILETKEIETDKAVDLIVDFAKENNEFYKLLKDSLATTNKTSDKPISVRKMGPKKKKEPKEIEYCYWCDVPLDPNRNHLKINGHKICHDCKNIEVQKFLLYLERRKLDAKEK